MQRGWEARRAQVGEARGFLLRVAKEESGLSKLEGSRLGLMRHRTAELGNMSPEDGWTWTKGCVTQEYEEQKEYGDCRVQNLMLLSNPNIKHPHCQSWSKGCENKIKTASFFLPLPLIKSAAFIHTQDILFSVRNNDTLFLDCSPTLLTFS